MKSVHGILLNITSIKTKRQIIIHQIKVLKFIDKDGKLI